MENQFQYHNTSICTCEQSQLQCNMEFGVNPVPWSVHHDIALKAMLVIWEAQYLFGEFRKFLYKKHDYSELSFCFLICGCYCYCSWLCTLNVFFLCIFC